MGMGEVPVRVTVILFKPMGKYYTEEDWTVPEIVKDWSESRGGFERECLAPFDMIQSPDFRRISGGAVLVPTQEPWGYPHLFPGDPDILAAQVDESSVTRSAMKWRR
jgi:hypothetical protein